MEPRDAENARFLLNLDKPQLRSFLATLDVDNLLYALSICEVAALEALDTEILDLTEANNLINRIKIKN